MQWYIYTEIKSYIIGQIFWIPAKFSLYLSIMWINNITIVAFVWGRYVVYIDQQKYIHLGLRPQSIYFCWVDIITYRPHTKAKLYNITKKHMFTKWYCVFDIIFSCQVYSIQTLCDKVYQWLAAGRWFSPGTPVSSSNKTDRHDIAEILLKVALNTINLAQTIDIIYNHAMLWKCRDAKISKDTRKKVVSVA